MWVEALATLPIWLGPVLACFNGAVPPPSDHGHSHDRYHSHGHGHSHGPQRQLTKPSATPPDQPKPTAKNGYSTCIYDVPKGGPGRHGGSINKDNPLQEYDRDGQTVPIQNEDDCADACFYRPGCIGMNFYRRLKYCYIKFAMNEQAKNELGWDSCTMVLLSENGQVLSIPDKAPKGDPVFEQELLAVRNEARLRRQAQWDRYWADPNRQRAPQQWGPSAQQWSHPDQPWPQPGLPSTSEWSQPASPAQQFAQPNPQQWAQPAAQQWSDAAQQLAAFGEDG